MLRTEAVEPAYAPVNGTYYSARTPMDVVYVLEQARRNHTVLRLHYGDRDTGRDWLEEHDVRGRVGRSTGPHKIPLLVIANGMGGTGILDDCIVKIYGPLGVLYKHPSYHHGEIAIVKSELKGYAVEAWVDGKVYARFESNADLASWIAKLHLNVTEARPQRSQTSCVPGS